MALTLPKFKLTLPFAGGSPAGRRGRLLSGFLPAKLLPTGGRSLALGLDIGSHAVKVCELQAAGDSFRLLRLGSALVPPDSIEDGALIQPEAVAATISRLLSNLGCKSKKVAISVSGYSVIVKKINLQVMSEEALEKHIHEEAEQYIPFDIDDVYLDCQDLHTGIAEGENTEVILAAAKKELVDGYLEMLEGLGLKTVVVDVDAFALENAYEACHSLDGDIALVDIGASKMNINIITGGTSALTRDVVLGGRQLSEQIQQALDISFAEAEAIKLGQAAVADESRQRVAELVLDTCRQWSGEIRRALDFYQTNHPEQPVREIVLSGGGARLAGLADFLGRELELPTKVFNPFSKTLADQERIDPRYLQAVAPEMAQAAGLATRTAEF